MPKKKEKSIIASGKLEDELLALKLGVERSDQAIFITDKEGVILYINPAFEKIYGFKASEAIGKTPRILKSGKESQKLYEEFWGTLLKKEIVNLELINKAKNGRLLNIKASANPIINGDNEIIGFLSIQSDITRQRELQMELSETEEKYQDIVENSPDMIHSVDNDGKIIFSNKSECDILGYKKEEIIGKSIYDIYSPGTWQEIKNGFDKLVKEGKLYVPDGKMINKKGELIDVEIDSVAIHNKNGDFVRTRSIIRDVTERKKAEEKYRSVVENANEIILIAQDATIKYANPKMKDVSGFSHKELYSKPFTEFIHPEDRDMVVDRHIRRIKGEAVEPIYNFRIIDKTGNIKWLEIRAVLFTWERRPATLNFMTDITERRNTEMALIESEKKYRAIFDQAIDSILLIDAQTGKFIEFNKAAHERLGYSRDEFEKLTISDFEVTERADQVKKHIQQVLDLGFETFETKHKTKKGNILNILVSSRAISIGGKNYLYSILRDITEEKAVQEKLLKEQEKYKILFDSSRDAIMTLEPPGWKFTSGNPATIEMFACDDEKDFTDHAPWQYSPKEQSDGQLSDTKAKEMILKAMKTGSNFFEWTHRRKNGEDFSATVLLTRMTVGEKTFLQATVRDVTINKISEDELKKKIEQMEFMGRVNLKRHKKMLQMQKEIIELKKRLGEDAPALEDLKEFMNDEGDNK